LAFIFLLGFIDRCSLLLDLRLGFLLNNTDVYVAPQSVAELLASGSGKTPVRNDLTRTSGCSKQNSEREFLARSKRSIADRRLRSGHKLRDASGMVRVYMSHVVATDKSDRAASRPVLLALVAEGPCLFENMVGGQNSAIRSGLTYKNTLQFSLRGWGRRWNRGFLLDLGLGSLDGHLGGTRLRRMDINNRAHRVDGVAANSRHGLSSLGSCLAITHFWHALSIGSLTSASDTDGTDGSLELNQGMCLVVSVTRAGLAIGAEIQVVANSTLVSSATDIAWISVASIA